MENAPDDDGYCGDGIVQITNEEECDDHNRVVTDGCVSKSHDHSQMSQLCWVFCGFSPVAILDPF